MKNRKGSKRSLISISKYFNPILCVKISVLTHIFYVELLVNQYVVDNITSPIVIGPYPIRLFN